MITPYINLFLTKVKVFKMELNWWRHNILGLHEGAKTQRLATQ